MPKLSIHQIIHELTTNITKHLEILCTKIKELFTCERKKIIITPQIIYKFFRTGEGEEVEYPELGKIAEVLNAGKI